MAHIELDPRDRYSNQARNFLAGLKKEIEEEIKKVDAEIAEQAAEIAEREQLRAGLQETAEIIGAGLQQPKTAKQLSEIRDALLPAESTEREARLKKKPYKAKRRGITEGERNDQIFIALNRLRMERPRLVSSEPRWFTTKEIVDMVYNGGDAKTWEWWQRQVTEAFRYWGETYGYIERSRIPGTPRALQYRLTYAGCVFAASSKAPTGR